MPLLLRPTAPSPSIDELAFAVAAAPLSSQCPQYSVPSATPELPRCATHGRLSLRSRRSTAGTETELHACSDEACNDPEHHHQQQHQHRISQQSLKRRSGVMKPTDVEYRDSKLSSRDTQPDDDHLSSDGSFESDPERASSVMSCSCSCADTSDFAITSSAVVIEDRQLAVVDKELRDFRKTLVRKLYSRFTKISGLARRRSSAATAKPVV